MQISSKVALSISLVVALVGAIGTTVAAVGHQRDSREQYCHKSLEAVRLLSLAIAPAFADGRHEQVQNVLDNLDNFRDEFRGIEDVRVVNGAGVVVAALDPQSFNTPWKPSARLRRSGGQCVWSATELSTLVPVTVTHRLGDIYARFATGEMSAVIERQRLRGIMLVVGAMLLIGFMLFATHRQLVEKRLRSLATVAHDFGDGNMKVRAEEKGDDEIGALGTSFNNMAAALQEYTQDLEGLVAERTMELEKLNSQLKAMATTDGLTGLYNRRYFDEQARRSLEVARRNQRPISIVIADTDRFKSINDRFGHPAGDEILKDSAGILRSNARKADVVARIGGEEFAVLMPEATAKLAAQAAERMRKQLEDAEHPKVPELGKEAVTASFGVAALVAEERLEDLLAAADSALYESKVSGRNKVTVHARNLDREGLPSGEGLATPEDGVELSPEPESVS
jgi:diguanylate cyclase (GGDEF)-like protein